MVLRGTALTGLVVGLWLAISPAAAPRSAQKNSQLQPQEGSARRSIVERPYAKEPYVLERQDLTARFENDGTEERDLSVRVRLQDDDGAQHFRDIVFSYVSPNETVSVRSAKIHRPDGSSVDVLAATNSTKETTTPSAHDLPAYSNVKELHLLASALQTGDVFEYDVVTRLVRPFAPGEFWFQYDFVRDAIALDERLELDLPQGRAFSIRAPDFSRVGGKEIRRAGAKLDGGNFVFTQTERSGHTILRWTHANLKSISADEQDARNREGAPPDVELTSFENWEAVAHRYAQSAHGSSKASPRIKTKTEELIRGAANDDAKARAICRFVSQKIRDANVSGTLWWIAARPAEAVLANGYGDSKDKATLLAAMLEAAAIRSETVLVPYKRTLDPQLPSPSQFDHAITTVRDGAKTVWIDATADLAPFGFLPAPLRGKSALLIEANGATRIVKTPADPPFESAQEVTIDARLSELGTLSGTVRYSLRGDTEFVLRTAFHRAPRAEWNQLAQTILTLDGLSGQVKDVTTNDPLDTEKPFQVTIAFSNPGAFEWPIERAKIALPLLNIATPDPPSKNGQPVKLGSPLDVETHLRLALPADFRVEAPTGIAVARDYAEFKSSYRLENGALIAQRALNFKAHEVPASGLPDYLAFTHAVQTDEAQPLLIENSKGAEAQIPADASSDDLFEAGTTALKAADTRGAILLLKRATERSPQHKRAWNELGLAYMQARRFEEAATAFQKQAQVNPSDERAHDYLGVALLQLHRDDAAADAFRKQIEWQPLDPVAHAQLGNLLLVERRYSDAVPELERAVVLSPDNAELEIRLGVAYLNIGDKDKAVASFEKAMEISPGAGIRNEAAYALAEQDAELDRAQRYAESADRITAAQLEKTDLAHVAPSDLAETNNIGVYWDTLGWIDFQRGDWARAERYIRAAWLLTQNGEVGDHLAQIYQKEGAKQRAIHQCALALATESPSSDTRARLMLMLGGNAHVDDLAKAARPELEKLRTFAVKLPVSEKASADFLLAMVPGRANGLSARVEAVRFAGGSESLRRFENSLKSIDYGDVFPDPTPMKLIRRGTLACEPAGTCRLTLELPADAAAMR
jgi:Flp pilus assembly protein TadD/transglutaminase-like putative cysteine protease